MVSFCLVVLWFLEAWSGSLRFVFFFCGSVSWFCLFPGLCLCDLLGLDHQGHRLGSIVL